SGTEVFQLGERGVELAWSRPGLDPVEPVAATGAARREQGRVVEDDERRAVEHPGRVGELDLDRLRGERLDAALRRPAIEVPPAGAIRHEVQPPIGAPRRLGDRLTLAARDGRPVAGSRQVPYPQPRG